MAQKFHKNAKDSPQLDYDDHSQRQVHTEQKPKFLKVMGIPQRQNKQDFPPPHLRFEVHIWNTDDRMSIIAYNLNDRRDFFEINVDGKEEVDSVMKKFDFNYMLISDSLRIMNDVMVLLNPKIIQQQQAKQNAAKNDTHPIREEDGADAANQSQQESVRIADMEKNTDFDVPNKDQQQKDGT